MNNPYFVTFKSELMCVPINMIRCVVAWLDAIEYMYTRMYVHKSGVC